jgi:calcium-dependent protein kinase
MGCLIQKKEEVEEEKKQNNYDEVLEDIVDIKAVQVKGNMLFSETEGCFKDHYEFKEKLQSNNSLTILTKVVNKFSGCIRLMKTIKKAFMDAQEDEKNFMKEIAILRTLDHMNILKIYEFYQDEKCYNLIMEYCSEGDLFEKIQKEAPFNEYTACHIIYQLLSAVSYCHSNNIVHRDIKADCILIESSENVTFKDENITLYNIRLSEFNYARSFNKKKKLTKKVGTSYYVAPEVLNRNYNEKCDIWSIGVLLFILLCGKPPFWGEDDKQITDKVRKGDPDWRKDEWTNVSQEGQDFVKLLLNTKSSHRPSSSEALQNKWFKKYLYKKPVNVDMVKDFYNNIVGFKTDPMMFFQQATLAYMIHHLLQKEDVINIRNFYTWIDNNGDGKMEYKELNDGFKQFIDINEKEVTKIFKYIDQAHTGCIEYEEFIRACFNKKTLLSEENLQKCFCLFIRNNSFDSVTIDVDRFKSLLGLSSKFTDKQWIMIIKSIDKNGDGQIEFDEFKDMMDLFLNP